MKDIKLYDCFNDWHFGGVIWLIGDTHFGDKDCKLINPNWPTPEEQIKLINSKVGKKDTLIILGDVGDESYVSKLKGYKVLITGNHDKGVSNYGRKEDFFDVTIDTTYKEAKDKYKNFKSFSTILSDRVAYCDNGLFDEVYNGPLFISDKILLSHEPIKLPFGYNIHGHVHNGLKYEYYSNSSVDINVCSDVVNWAPVRLDDAISQFKVTDIHRLTIDKASKDKE